MEPSELLLHWRGQADDLAEPYLWSNNEVALWIDDAQEMFCRLTDGIEDVLPLTIVADTEWYAKDVRILQTRGITHYLDPLDSGRGRDVRVVNYETYKRECRSEYFETRTGPIGYMVDGVRKNYYRASPIPNEGGTLQLMVYRLPVSAADTDIFEIDRQHHLALCSWVFFRAYSKHDADTFDPRRAAVFQAEFEDYCKQAKREQGRARTDNSATVAYGGY